MTKLKLIGAAFAFTLSTGAVAAGPCCADMACCTEGADCCKDMKGGNHASHATPGAPKA